MASDKHWLPLLVDDVIVNPADKRTIWTTGTRCVYMIWRKSPVKHRELTEASNSDSPDGRCNFTKTAIASIAPRFRKYKLNKKTSSIALLVVDAGIRRR